MNFLAVIGLFGFIILYGKLVEHWTKDEKTKRENAKGELIPIVSEKEKGYNLKGNSILNLRMMSLFMAIEDEKEKEKTRQRFIEIVNTYKMKPAKFFLLQLSRAFFYVGMIYVTVFFFYEEPNIYLAYTVIAVIALMNIVKKQWVLAVLLGVIGLLIYPKLPATILLLILLNRIWYMVKQGKKK